MVKNLQWRRPEFDPWVGRIHWRREWLHALVLLPGEFHGQRSLMGYSPWGHKKSAMVERLTLAYGIHSNKGVFKVWRRLLLI